MKKIVSFIVAAVLALSILAIPSFVDAKERENIALEKTVETYAEENAMADLVMPNWFSAANLVDGLNEEWDGDPANTEPSLCWYTVADKRNTDISAIVDLEKVYDIGEIRLYPSKFLSGQGTPSTFDVEISLDGDIDGEWTVVGGESKLKDTTRSDPFVYNAGGQQGQYIRIHILRESAISDGKFYGGFGELEVYEFVYNYRDFNADTDKQYFDQILVNGEEKANGNDAVAALKALIDGSDGSIETITMFGWFGLVDTATPFSEMLDSFGYVIDDGKPVFDKSFTVAETEQEVLDGNGMRYRITANVSKLKDGETHVIKACVKLTNGDVVLFNRENREAIINYKAPVPATPEPTEVPTENPTDEPTGATDPEATTPRQDTGDTNEPSTGCGSVIGIGWIVALAGVVCVAKRRK